MWTLLFASALAWDPHLDAPGDLQLGVDYGFMVNSDARFDLFSDGTLPSGGVRFGYKVHPRVALVATGRLGQTGTYVGGDGDTYGYDYDSTYYTDYDYDYDSEGFATRWRSGQVTLGVKADLPLAKWIHPYAALSGVGVFTGVQLDDDLAHDDNTNQIRHRNLTGGGQALGGAEIRFHTGLAGVMVVPYIELGYTVLAPVKLGVMGEVPFHGFTENLGMAVYW